MPGGVGFGGQHGLELCIRQFGDHSVIDDAGRVDDRGQPVLVGDGHQYRGKVGGVAGVAGGDGDLGAQLGQALVQLGGPRRGRPAARDQQQVPHAVMGDQVLGEDPAQHPRSAGDQCCALRIPAGGRYQYQLAGVAGLAHIPECLLGLQQAVVRGGQWSQDPGGEKVAQRGPSLAKVRWPCHVQVVGLVGDAGVCPGDLAG
ncbi:hypothetical protein MSIMFI_05477 [Mycobacterium simulans]|nr:hypothetical protein MSIMFI_05477 [Mycobacterium simulans]